MRHRLSNGKQISGFIDYEESLRKSILEYEEGAIDWCEIFEETKRLVPRKCDLGFVETTTKRALFKKLLKILTFRFYNWGSGFSVLNDTKNFKSITDPNVGLIFESRHDRHQILVDPHSKPGNGTTRTIVYSPHYDHVVLFDHVVRNKI